MKRSSENANSTWKDVLLPSIHQSVVFRDTFPIPNRTLPSKQNRIDIGGVQIRIPAKKNHFFVLLIPPLSRPFLLLRPNGGTGVQIGRSPYLNIQWFKGIWSKEACWDNTLMNGFFIILKMEYFYDEACYGESIWINSIYVLIPVREWDANVWAIYLNLIYNRKYCGLKRI